jgi:hypothetical protein
VASDALALQNMALLASDLEWVIRPAGIIDVGYNDSTGRANWVWIIY